MGSNELLVKEVIFPRKTDEAGTSYRSTRVADFGGETYEENAVGGSMKIGAHEVKQVGGLKLLQKKPLGNYFGGTEKRKPGKRRAKVKRVIYNLNDLPGELPDSYTNDTEKPIMKLDSLKEQKGEQGDKEVVLHMKMCKYQEKRESFNHTNHIWQRLAEENYLEQLENMAESWDEYRKRRRQLDLSDNFYRRRHPERKPLACSKIGFSVISRKYWHDDSKDSIPSPRKDKKTERGKEASEDTRQQSKYGELGQELLEKLVFVDDEG